MISIDIPGHRTLSIEHIVIDCNGTIAIDGKLIDGVAPLIKSLARDTAVHVITADTVGNAASLLEGLPCSLSVIPTTDQAMAKFEYVHSLGPDSVAAIGNGRNDRLMLDIAALGIAVIQREGAAFPVLSAADVICPDIISALELLLNPLRLIATLRS